VKERAGMGFPTEFPKHFFSSQHAQIGKSAAHTVDRGMVVGFSGYAFAIRLHTFSFLKPWGREPIRPAMDSRVACYFAGGEWKSSN